ncbi:MAG TPA: bifunctional glutamate N-acetyltransferase/amino-acid acetyltransferase ArgJ [Spirochaetota bacterium]|nr:bifunctional glutamate N-acetyltransferase/amino-acid acetyltransferase ArgJ [Spirochaetota bacterium]
MTGNDNLLGSVPGFRFSAVECGIRYQGRLDYCLIAADAPCNAAGMFTKNRLFAAPVRLCRERTGNKIRAILINATNANACTGDEGYANAAALTADMAEKLGCGPEEILMCSTGIIGHQLPVDRMKASHPSLASKLSREAGALIPRAIMTTDTVPKSASRSFTTSRGRFTVAGTVKGSGMIAPDMATMLAFIITDAPVSKNDLDGVFRNAVNRTFNRITIDGDMSTNDTALLLSPDSDRPLSEKDDLGSFAKALEETLYDLAVMLVSDGEGATKLVTVRVIGAQNDADAAKAARAVAQSLLVKTAFFGNDPNWGRIGAAAGYSGAALDEKRLSIYYGDVPLLIRGVPQKQDQKALAPILAGREFTVTVDIGLGNAESTMLTTDISYEYVKINAEYTT